jgi:RNA polymerase sigma-70 factor, ECF subfamily
LILTSTLDALQRRESAAQRRVYEQYSNTLYWTSFRYVRERMVAEDIVVESFMKIFEAVPNVKFESLKNFEAWMKRIVINESLSYLRKIANFRMMPETDAIEEPVNDYTLEKISAEEIHALIAKLPDGYRTVFNLYAVEGYTHREIGEMLGISEGTSKSQLNHARKLLQKRILQINQDATRHFL